jgi:hypothetical protein
VNTGSPGRLWSTLSAPSRTWNACACTTYCLKRLRATRRLREPSSDAEIECGLREKAVSDPGAAEILLPWLTRPRAEERVGGVDLDSMSEHELERLYAGLLKLAALPDEELRALVGSLLAETQDD